MLLPPVFLLPMNLALHRRSLLLLCFVGLFSCSESEPPQEHHSDSNASKKPSAFREVYNWLGVYQDTLPCADCAGILTRLELRSDSTYKKSVIYLGKKPLFDHTFGTQSRFRFDAAAEKIWLDSTAEKGVESWLIVGDSALHMCSKTGNAMPSDQFQLKKI